MAVQSVKLEDGQIRMLGRIKPKSVKRFGRLKLVLHPDDTVSLVPELEDYVEQREFMMSLPESVDYGQKAKASVDRMYANDRMGDCVIAGKYHAIGIWSGNDTPTCLVVEDAQVISEYKRICGPGDNGCNITSVLDEFRRNGLPVGSTKHKIDGYVSVNNRNKELVKFAIHALGCLTLGIDLPSAWTTAPGIWDVTNTRIVGGHDVLAFGYNEQGVLISTWGDICTITWPAFLSSKWISETYAHLSPDWYNEDKLSPGGINVNKLQADLNAIGGGTIPPDNPPPTPQPPPPTPPGPPQPPPVGKAVLTLTGSVTEGKLWIASLGSFSLSGGNLTGNLPPGTYEIVPQRGEQ